MKHARSTLARRRRRRRSRLLPAALALAAVVVLAVAGWLLLANRPENRAPSPSPAETSAAVSPAPTRLSRILLSAPAADGGDGYALSLYEGEYFDVSASLDSGMEAAFQYASDSPGVSVDSSGRISARSSGEAAVTVSAPGCEPATLRVDVRAWTERAPLMIAHAMGGIDGHSYTNSREAFLENYAKGFRAFEADFSYTSDGGLALCHGWDEIRLNSSVEKGYVPALEEFRSMKLIDRYTPLSVDDLFDLMLEYPDILVITDTKSGSAETARRQFSDIVARAKAKGAESALDRMVVQLYNPGMYEVVEGVHHFEHYICTLYKALREAPTREELRTIASFCAQRGVDLIVMPDRWWSTDYPPILEEFGVPAALHTINDADAARKFLGQGVRGIYTDFLPPGGAE